MPAYRRASRDAYPFDVTFARIPPGDSPIAAREMLGGTDARTLVRAQAPSALGRLGRRR